MILLADIQFTTLNSTTYCATASLSVISPLAEVKQTLADKKLKRQSQRAAVRLLLNQLLSELGLEDSLDESEFPYRLTNQRYYVCFSHSANQVAVVLSYHRAVGIDIEVNAIAWQVAKRYYHSSEIIILESLPIAQRDYLVKILWQIKESKIKIEQNKLATGLGIAYPAVIQKLIEMNHLENSFDLEKSNEWDGQNSSPYQVTFLQTQQTIIIF